MRLLDYKTLSSLKFKPSEFYDWVDYVMKNKDNYIMPTKTKIKLDGSDYFNIMPSILPKEEVMGIKLINRSENRSINNKINLDSQILLYEYNTKELLSILDGNYITTIRTAAVAVHTLLNCVENFEIISIVGLGNIAYSIGEILFEKIQGKKLKIKLYKYKDHAERFMKKFNHFKNIEYEICDNYDKLMENSDVIISCVSYIEKDFFNSNKYKAGVTIIPVHMRGFMECDKCFDHIISSDMQRIKEFKYYKDYKKLSYIGDILNNNIKLREKKKDRVIIYNLGLSIMDIYFAKMLYQKAISNNNIKDINLAPINKYYMWEER